MDNYAVKLFESLQKLKVTDENKAEVKHNKTKSKKKKFCRVLESGCTPYVDYRKLALM